MSVRPLSSTGSFYSDDVKSVLKQLESFARILEPKDVDEPILAPNVRSSILTWLRELDHTDKLKEVGLKPRRTALLYGPPGTGKTTLAHHLAARRGLPLVAVQSEDLISKYVGETGNNMSKLFRLLDSVANKVVVLFDEFDAIAPHRSSEQSADKERSAYLAVMLRRVEQFEGVCLAATNKKDDIDSAMWRRFDMQISVDLPGAEERFAIIRRYAYPFDLSDEDTDLLVDLTFGASPSLLRQLMEGMKRVLVLGPMLGHRVGDPVAVFEQIKSSISPPPEMDTPELWKGQKDIGKLAKMSWPPKRVATN
jgi:RecA/RadA recombinase